MVGVHVCLWVVIIMGGDIHSWAALPLVGCSGWELVGCGGKELMGCGGGLLVGCGGGHLVSGGGGASWPFMVV